MKLILLDSLRWVLVTPLFITPFLEHMTDIIPYVKVAGIPVGELKEAIKDLEKTGNTTALFGEFHGGFLYSSNEGFLDDLDKLNN